jgi:transposase-like protein
MTDPDSTKAQAVDLYREGRSLLQVSNVLGVSKRTVQKWITDMGAMRPKGPQRYSNPQGKRIRIDPDFDAV